MARPTEQASFKFRKAYGFADKAGGFYQVTRANGSDEMGNRYLSAAVREMAEGLQHLSDGLRATYILLDKLTDENTRR